MSLDNKHRLSWLFLRSLIVGIFISACSPGEMMTTPKKKVLESQKERIQNPSAAAEDLDSLVNGSTDFALDFYQEARNSKSNLFFSPYSISSALAMTYGGASGITAAEIAETLHFSLPGERLHPVINQLDLLLNQGKSSGEEKLQPFQLDVANAIWGQEGHPFKHEYLDLLALYYGTGMRLVDYITSSETARQEINSWVSKKTQDKIQDLIPPGGIDADTRLVLANAIYFKADWLHPFANASTRAAPFYLPDGNPVQVPTMAFEDPVTLPYFSSEGFQAVELPYVGAEVSMLVLVPDQGKLEAFEADLDTERLHLIFAGLQPTAMKLFLPKFKFTSEYELTGILSDLGMQNAFCTGSPDFSRMDEKGNLCIGGVFHKAFVAVDEKGTEAAAATAVVMKALSMMDPNIQVLNVDRPFIFLIRHKPSGTILFTGRVQNPLE